MVWEYSCRYCHHHFELPKRIKETDLLVTKCLNMQCQKYGLSRVYSGNNIHFKGSGFTKKIR